GVGALIRRGSWPELPIFGLMQRLGSIPDDDMFHVFNMGLGMLVIVPPAQVELTLAALPGQSYTVGEIQPGNRQVKRA
ncbi:MAG: phosphoribosylformylglycinamidine cyclo-ligase, partial [Anaerolineae bacterium]|nr:phosphoribosylformylglycinamidine cyclo-ligase [Anaerolineae bacterium]